MPLLEVTTIIQIYCSALYFAPMWVDCTKTVLKMVKVKYNSSLRRFMRSLPWRNRASEMFVNFSIDSLDEMLRIFTFGLMSRVIVLNNLLILDIYNSVCHLYSTI